MGRKFFDIGEEFQVGLSRLKCIAQQEDKRDSCEGCFFFSFYDCADVNLHIVGECETNKRDDLQDVIFVKLNSNNMNKEGNKYNSLINAIDGLISELNIVRNHVQNRDFTTASEYTDGIVTGSEELRDKVTEFNDKYSK